MKKMSDFVHGWCSSRKGLERRDCADESGTYGNLANTHRRKCSKTMWVQMKWRFKKEKRNNRN